MILNVSHYMTDIIYLLYYLEKTNEPISNEYRPQLTKRIVSLREEFRELLNKRPVDLDETNNSSSNNNNNNNIDKWKDEMDGVLRFQTILNDDDLLYLLHKIIEDVSLLDGLTHGIKLHNQLNNCEIGLNNIINFLNHIVDPNGKDIIYDDTIDKILNEELINVWRVEMDLSNCLIFDIITHDSVIIDAYNAKSGCSIESKDISKGDTFIKFITWLKDEEVFDGVVDV